MTLSTNAIIILVLAIAALVIILLIFMPKFKFFGDIGGCEKSGGKCEPESKGCNLATQYQSPLQCPRDNPSDPKKVCCVTRSDDV